MLLDRTMNLPLCWKFCAVISLAINQQTSAPTRRHTCCLVMVIACGKKKKMCEREREREGWGNVEYRTSKTSTDAVTSSNFCYLQHTKPDRGLNMLHC